MLKVTISLLSILFIINAVLIVLCLKEKHKLSEANFYSQEERNQQEKALEEIEQKIALSKQQNQALDVEINDKLAQVSAAQERYDTLTANLTQIQDTYDVLVKQAEQNYVAELEELKRKNKEEIDEANLITQVAINKINGQVDDCQKLYASLISSYQIANEESDARRHVQISLTTREDIDFMLNYVSSRLKNPTIISKLIWSEYFQKPTNDMLDFVLPSRDCAGIYKITNDETKEAYIGRSVSVRKRLTDHIKSALGIDTIADQHVHQVMREKGIWNFTFELIEECSREKLNEREKYYIEFFHTDQYGYNQKAGG